MKTVCLDCKKTWINIPWNTECWNCKSKNTFLIVDNVELKDIQDSITDHFLQEFNLNK